MLLYVPYMLSLLLLLLLSHFNGNLVRCAAVYYYSTRIKIQAFVRFAAFGMSDDL